MLHGEAVKPQRYLGQLDGQGVLVDAVDAALEHHTADDGLVGELGLVQDPVRLLGPLKYFASNGGHTIHQGRNIVAVEPLRDHRHVFDQVGDGVGQEVPPP